jgi:AAA domain/Viral (Superfamily 1) RNA helicase
VPSSWAWRRRRRTAAPSIAATITSETDTSRPGAEPGRRSRDGTKPEDRQPGEARNTDTVAPRPAQSDLLGRCIARRDVVGLLEALTQQTPTFTQQRLDHVLRRHIEDAAARASFAQTIRAHHATVALADDPDGRITRYTTRRVLDEEQHALAASAELAGKSGYGVDASACSRVLGAGDFATLSAEQKHAIAGVTGDHALAVIWGQAGTGKSFVLNAARASYEAAGYDVVGLAPTNVVAADLGAAGFARTSTIHAELYALARGRRAWTSRTVVMVDEAAMIDSALIGKLAHQARQAGAKLILAGDDRQFASIARGGLFSVLKERYGAATLTEVRRQRRDDDRRASQLMAKGEFQAALNLYEGQGAISWNGSQAAAREALIAAWAEDRSAHPKATQLVLAYTNDEVAKLNAALRAVCKRRGELGPDRMFETAQGSLAFARGERIQFTGTDKPRGILNGSAGRITNIVGNDISVRLDDGTTVRFDAAAFTKFQHGYASTLHRSQGRTFDRSYLLYSKHWRAAANYVALTRHRDAMRLFVNRALARDLPTLARQMKRVDERRAASFFYRVADVPASDAADGAVATAGMDEASYRAPSSFVFEPPSQPFWDERGDARREKGQRVDVGDVDTPPKTMAPVESAAGDTARPVTGFVSPDPVLAAADLDREPVVAPDVMPNMTEPRAFTPASPGRGAAKVKTLFRAAAAEAAEVSAKDTKKKTRRRSEGDRLPRLIQPRADVLPKSAVSRRAAARGRYAGLETRQTSERPAPSVHAAWMERHAGCDERDDTITWLDLWEDNAAFDYGIHDDYSAQTNHLSPNL